jgi:hypothetical protein
MARNTKPAASALVNDGGRLTDSSGFVPTYEPAAPKKTAKPKSVPPAKTKKAGRPPRSSRAAAKAEKLVCRYCGSDDLAPSFEKRRDARCRACFKKRYGSAARTKRATRTRKSNAAK